MPVSTARDTLPMPKTNVSHARMCLTVSGSSPVSIKLALAPPKNASTPNAKLRKMLHRGSIVMMFGSLLHERHQSNRRQSSQADRPYQVRCLPGSSPVPRMGHPQQYHHGSLSIG